MEIQCICTLSCFRLLLYDVDSFAYYSDYRVCKVDETPYTDKDGNVWKVDDVGLVTTLDETKCVRIPTCTVIVFVC